MMWEMKAVMGLSGLALGTIARANPGDQEGVEPPFLGIRTCGEELCMFNSSYEIRE